MLGKSTHLQVIPKQSTQNTANLPLQTYKKNQWTFLLFNTGIDISLRNNFANSGSCAKVSVPVPGHRRVEYQCSSMWNKLPVTIRTVAEELGFRRLLKEHLLASLWYVTGRLSTNWGSAPWLAAVLLRRGPCHLYLWSDWLMKQCKALMLACLLTLFVVLLFFKLCTCFVFL